MSVMEAVDPDVVLEGGAGHRGEEKQLEALGRRHAEGLPDQREAAQLLREDVAGSSLQLAVIEMGGCLLAQVQYILQVVPGGQACPALQSPKGRVGGALRQVSEPEAQAPL